MRAAVRMIGVVVAAAPLLGGCVLTSPVVLTTAGIAEGTSLMGTKKSLVDHVVSGIRGEDCSSLVFMETGTYCPEKVVVDRSNTYCYRTLADVDCHYLPDPYRNGHVATGSPPPVRVPVEKAKGWFDD